MGRRYLLIRYLLFHLSMDPGIPHALPQPLTFSYQEVFLALNKVAISIQVYSMTRAACQHLECLTKLDLMLSRKQLTSASSLGQLLVSSDIQAAGSLLSLRIKLEC